MNEKEKKTQKADNTYLALEANDTASISNDTSTITEGELDDIDGNTKGAQINDLTNTDIDVSNTTNFLEDEPTNKEIIAVEDDEETPAYTAFNNDEYSNETDNDEYDDDDDDDDYDEYEDEDNDEECKEDENEECDDTLSSDNEKLINNTQEKPSPKEILLRLVCVLCPIVGIILYLINLKKAPKISVKYGKYALYGILIGLVVCMFISLFTPKKDNTEPNIKEEVTTDATTVEPTYNENGFKEMPNGDIYVKIDGQDVLVQTLPDVSNTTEIATNVSVNNSTTTSN